MVGSRLRLLAVLELALGLLALGLLWNVSPLAASRTPTPADPHPIAIGLAALLLPPGVLLALCSLGLASNRPTFRSVARLTALLITLAQMIVLLVMLAWVIRAVLQTGTPAAVSVPVMVLGTPALLLVWVLHGLWTIGRGPEPRT